ncbi:hypothetical protein SAMN04244553_1151 [Nocardia amikacinitolerans]|uniref:Uncharacterized protein n=1 Tax=Nocardia amikacinitolerans TaxID=756689 RepID=A0A285KZ94_9NOCA|nr:hypothetical protein [Nocardia amikacinitolerans]MCP2279252.1 hypothetical protein [Nocardia amikacinitolerans]MCP2296959.1 hypothetical protein [Nocardia amikacinitolerans]MCP2317778.1 hypothetical protein [Nocardia amikacinitolerans]SNY77969.1 hypothetical protein SAMN04244553_1151 [Nocardia amikacinitolerans]
MTLNRKQLQQFSARAGVVAAVAAAGVVGLAAPSTAIPHNPDFPFTPTLTRLIPTDCSAIIDAAAVRQEKPGTFGVRVKVTQTGESCADWKVAVRFKNLDTGYADGQQHPVVNGVVQHTVDGVIVGFGTAPGLGRVEARIVALDSKDREMEQISGTATFTLS